MMADKVELLTLFELVNEFNYALRLGRLLSSKQLNGMEDLVHAHSSQY